MIKTNPTLTKCMHHSCNSLSYYAITMYAVKYSVLFVVCGIFFIIGHAVMVKNGTSHLLKKNLANVNNGTSSKF